MIKDRRIALGYRAFCFVFTLIAILSIQNYFSDPIISVRQLMYYTVQSNILVLVMFGILTVKTALGLKNDGKFGSCSYSPTFVMVCAVDIFLTFLVYWAMLVPQSFSMGGGFNVWTFSNLAVHAIVPILCIADYFIFAESGHLKYKSIYLVLIFPLFYLVFATIAGFSGYVFRTGTDGKPVRFPYFFIDYDRTHIGMIILYVLLLTALFIGLCHLLYLFDKKVAKKVLYPKVATETVSPQGETIVGEIELAEQTSESTKSQQDATENTEPTAKPNTPKGKK